MELTLTGASLVPTTDRSSSAPSRMTGGSDGGGSVVVGQHGHGGGGGGGGCNHNHNHGHHHHHPNHASAQQAGAAAALLARAGVKNVSKEDKLQAIQNAAKCGTYEMFVRLADTYFPPSPTPSTSDDNNDNDEGGVGVGDGLEELCEYGNDGHTVVHWCAKRHPDTRFVQYLVDKCQNHRNNNSGSSMLLEMLLHRPSRNDDVGMYPIHWACTEGSIPIVSLLLRHIGGSGGGGVGAAGGSVVVGGRRITMSGGSVNNSKWNKGSDGGGGHHDQHQHPELKRGYSSETKSLVMGSPAATSSSAATDSSSPLFSSSDNKSSTSTKSTSSSMAVNNPLETRDKSGCTPLLIASQYGHADLVAFLIKRGADVTALDNNCDSALHWAAYKGVTEVVGLLCHLSLGSGGGGSGGSGGNEEEGEDEEEGCKSMRKTLALDAKDVYGQTPIHLAALRGNSDVLEYLLEEADVQHGGAASAAASGADNDPASSTTGAAIGSVAVVVESGGSSGGVDDDGVTSGKEGTTTATTISSPQQSPPTVMALIEMVDKDGRTPLDLSIKYKRQFCQSVLREWEDRYNLLLVYDHNNRNNRKYSKSMAYMLRCTGVARQLCSYQKWKEWSGLGGGGGHNQGENPNSSHVSNVGSQQRQLKWPFYLVIFIMVWSGFMYPFVFLSGNIRVTGGSMGHPLWHLFTLCSMIGMWICFILTYVTNPGRIESFDRNRNYYARGLMIQQRHRGNHGRMSMMSSSLSSNNNKKTTRPLTDWSNGVKARVLSVTMAPRRRLLSSLRRRGTSISTTSTSSSSSSGGAVLAASSSSGGGMVNEGTSSLSISSSLNNRRSGGAAQQDTIDTRMHHLTVRLRAEYDGALERLAFPNVDGAAGGGEQSSGSSGSTSADTSSSRQHQQQDNIPPHPEPAPLCHTCRIVKPLRSKHCRVQRRCILLFDHYCPFVGNTIGLYNYRYFYGFVLCVSLSEIGFLLTWIQYVFVQLPNNLFDDLPTLFSGIIIGLFALPGIGMASYHTMLLHSNLTTNEHQNLYRYKYLQDPERLGQYDNPFDGGVLHNLYTRFMPNEKEHNSSAPGKRRIYDPASGAGAGAGAGGGGDPQWNTRRRSQNGSGGGGAGGGDGNRHRSRSDPAGGGSATVVVVGGGGSSGGDNVMNDNGGDLLDEESRGLMSNVVV